MIELKYHPAGSHETLLRCVLEIYTYYKFLNKERFINDYIENYPHNLKGHASDRDELAFDSNAKFELIILFDNGAKDISEYAQKYLYMLCKEIASKEDIVFRFCKLARSEDSTNEKFEAVQFMEDKEKNIPVDFDWHIGKYYIQEQFIID